MNFRYFRDDVREDLSSWTVKGGAGSLIYLLKSHGLT